MRFGVGWAHERVRSGCDRGGGGSGAGTIPGRGRVEDHVRVVTQLQPWREIVLDVPKNREPQVTVHVPPLGTPSPPEPLWIRARNAGDYLRSRRPVGSPRGAIYEWQY